MRIIIDAVGIRGHGGAAVLCELLKWLPRVRPNWQFVTFLLPRASRQFELPTVAQSVTVKEVYGADSDLGRLVWTHLRVERRFTREDGNVLLSFANVAPPTGRIPSVVFCHQPNLFFEDGNRLRGAAARIRLALLRYTVLRGMHSSRAIILQTKSMADAVSSCDRRLSGKIVIIPSGYRSQIDSSGGSESFFRTIDALPRPRLAYVAHPSEHKNHLGLIRALPHMLQQMPTLRLILTLDPGERNDRRYSRFVSQIRSAAEDMGVGESIVWLGRRNETEVVALLKRVDMLVFPSFSESFGLPLAEAIAAGCPIAASDRPFAHDVAGGASIYFDPRDPLDIAQAVIRLASDQSLAARLSGAAKALKPQYSYDSIAERLACVLADARQSQKVKTATVPLSQ